MKTKTNPKIKKFENKLNSLVIEQKENIKKYVQIYMDNFKTIDFTLFNNNNRYTGELKNNIFFTYSDCYRANSPISMMVGNLHNAHINMDDRGYIKGVATDLDGYLKLRKAKYLNHNLECIVGIYYPHFRESKNKQQYIDCCNKLIAVRVEELNNYVTEHKALMNEELNTMTDCFLLNYIKEI